MVVALVCNAGRGQPSAHVSLGKSSILAYQSTISPTTMATMATKKISSTASTATLDLVDILSASPLADDSLLATRLSFSSISPNPHSFDDVPPLFRCRISGGSGFCKSAPSVNNLQLDSHEDSHCTSCESSDSQAQLTAVEDDTVLLAQCSPAISGNALFSSSATPEEHAFDGSVSTYVPTITVSNSSAFLPVSLDSSQNLRHELSLAVRRGKKPLPALSLGKPTRDGPTDGEPYPDIPTAFLGLRSSGCQSPTFSLSSRDPSKFTMGLSAMCNSLKALVPPPPFTPTECDPLRSRTEPETRWGMVTSAQLPEVDEDEWAFAQDLVVEWHASRGLRAEVSPPPSPAGDLPYAVEIATPVSEGFPSPVTSTPALSDSSSSESSTEEPSPQTPASVKQLRRKTVIIQAPDSHADLAVDLKEIGKVQKVDKFISSAADRTLDILPDDFDQPVPFETPASTVTLVSTEVALSTPPGSRPSSTSSAKLPVRGILKEKKSVRFSSVPSLHEYSVSDRQAVEEVPSEQPNVPRPCTPCPGAASRRHLEPATHLGGKHASLTAAPLRSSPLRESHSPACPGMDIDRSARKHQPYATRPPITPLPPTPSSQPRATMAKHPAVRALARRPHTFRPSARACSLGSGEGGAVVGAPDLQSPTPVLLEAQRRAPLKSINARQQMPMQRKPDVLIPVKPSSMPMRHAPVKDVRRASRSREQDHLGGDHRGARMTPTPVNPRRAWDRDARRRSGAVAKGDACGGAPMHAGTRINSGSSKMPVPLRSILTKLRT